MDAELNTTKISNIGGVARRTQTDHTKSPREYYIKNHLGSTVTMVNDEGEKVADVFEYFPYGKQILEETHANVPITETFTGKELDRLDYDLAIGDDGVGLYYFGARYYDPEVGLWTSCDPSEQFWSPYSYTGNGINPIIGVDPDGRDVRVFSRAVSIGGYRTKYNHMVIEVYNRAQGAPDATYSLISRGAEKIPMFARDWPADVAETNNAKSSYVISQNNPSFDEAVMSAAANYRVEDWTYPPDAGIFWSGRQNSNTTIISFFLDMGMWFYPDIFFPNSPAPGFTEGLPGANGNVSVDVSGVTCSGCVD